MTITSIDWALAVGFCGGGLVATIVWALLVSRADRLRKRAAEETATALLSALKTAAAIPQATPTKKAS